ncbi:MULTISPECIES: hypothetical protein [Haloterrigena]|uniref:hypothetical protein n=1 Tax=Haloterrigena TaxID=121871 RepID=UPI0011D0E086|nr:hypothetical protein [Haloterrigena turkmenica]
MTQIDRAEFELSAVIDGVGGVSRIRILLARVRTQILRDIEQRFTPIQMGVPDPSKFAGRSIDSGYPPPVRYLAVDVSIAVYEIVIVPSGMR